MFLIRAFAFKNIDFFWQLHNANSLFVSFHVENAFHVLKCQMCGKYSKTKPEVMKHFETLSNFCSELSFLRIQAFVRKAKTNTDWHFSDKAKALIRNVSSQPL